MQVKISSWIWRCTPERVNSDGFIRTDSWDFTILGINVWPFVRAATVQKVTVIRWFSVSASMATNCSCGKWSTLNIETNQQKCFIAYWFRGTILLRHSNWNFIRADLLASSRTYYYVWMNIRQINIGLERLIRIQINNFLNIVKCCRFL